VFSERDPDALADIGDVAGGRGLGCADGPAWLVGDDHPGCRRIADFVGQRGKHLADADVGGCSGVEAGGLSHAENWDEAIAKRCADLRGDNRIGSPEQRAAFDVADLDMGTPDLGQFCARDLTREGSAVLGGEILGSDPNVGTR
jgi:hypothetical protein